ncbi:MAG: ribonuclease R [Bacteroidales bacterium]|nr:ribonuclease R [Bacteroidales bacterium]
MKKPKKKKPKGKSNFRNNIISAFCDNPFKAYNYKQIAAALGIKDRSGKDLIRTILLELIQDETILEIKTGKFKLSPSQINKYANKKAYVAGVVDMKQTGKAYIISDEIGEDIFIAANNTKHSLNGDLVKVYLFPKRRGRKTEGQVIEILNRKKTQFVGILDVSKNFAFLKTDNPSVPIDLFIPKDKLMGGKNGQKAVARITEWPEMSNNPFGEVIKVLGKPGDNDVEMESILAEYDFPLSFPKNVEKEAGKIPAVVPSSEIKKRKDFRNVLTFTIDPADAKDFDDAISVKRLENGNIEVGVHIADVSHYVKPNSIIDKEAYERGTSIYLVDRVIPMLPEKLSNFVCSLRPDEEKLCFAAVFELDDSVKILNTWFGKTIIKSNRRFSYEEVQKVIEEEKGAFSEEILVLNNYAKILRKKRMDQGAFAFESTEVKFILDERGKPIGVKIKEQKDSHKLIEEFMLLANKEVAEKIGKKTGRKQIKTFVYRIHDNPSPEKLNTFAQFISKMGYHINLDSKKNISKSFNDLFKNISGKGEQNMIETLAIRTMAKARYSTNNHGHYGLSFDYYTHFTSPIRRYPDLIVHRLLEMYLNGLPSVNATEYENKCNHSTEMEIRATEAERASIKYKQAEFFKDKLGEKFEGRISGISKWGIYVEVIKYKCEGMVRLNDINDDYYYIDEDNYTVTGQKYGNIYKLGDVVNVVVKQVDLSKRQIDFLLV